MQVYEAMVSVNKQSLDYFKDIVSDAAKDELKHKLVDAVMQAICSGEKIVKQEDVSAELYEFTNEVIYKQKLYIDDLVRCNKCQHCLKIDEYEMWCNIASPMHLVRPFDFCSRGKKEVQ